MSLHTQKTLGRGTEMIKPRSALILGGAKSVFEDYQSALQMINFDVVIAVNDIGIEIPEIDVWCSMHPEKIPMWLEARRRNGFRDPRGFWTTLDKTPPKDVDFQKLRNTRGGSGLLAVYVARYLNCDKIVLAGIPLTVDGEHYHTPGHWKECKLYRVIWEADASLLNDVRSMSGWTKERFGQVTPDWLAI